MIVVVTACVNSIGWLADSSRVELSPADASVFTIDKLKHDGFNYR